MIQAVWQAYRLIFLPNLVLLPFRCHAHGQHQIVPGLGLVGQVAQQVGRVVADDDRHALVAVHLLAQAAYFERNSNPVQAKQNLSGAHAHVREHQGPMGNLFRDTLTEHIGWFRQGSRADWELALADRYLQRQDYLRTITYLCEAYISRATEKFGGNVNQFEDRDLAFKDADKNQDVWLLKHLRNAMTHGVRTDNRDAKRLLQDQQALDIKLRSLRKSLFQ